MMSILQRKLTFKSDSWRKSAPGGFLSLLPWTLPPYILTLVPSCPGFPALLHRWCLVHLLTLFLTHTLVTACLLICQKLKLTGAQVSVLFQFTLLPLHGCTHGITRRAITIAQNLIPEATPASACSSQGPRSCRLPITLLGQSSVSLL
jgi:hypothetical protein